MRGQGVWPHRVPLEPPFRRFLATPRTRSDEIVDDGRKPGLWNRLRARGAEPKTLASPTTEVPELRPPDPRDIAELRLLAPESMVVKGEIAARLIASIGKVGDRIGFEVIGTSEDVSVQLACAEPFKRGVTTSLRAYCPEVKVREEWARSQRRGKPAGIISPPVV